MHSTSQFPPPKAELLRLLLAVMPRPDPMLSAEQADKYAHLDLPGASDGELESELAGLNLLFLAGQDRDDWWGSRLDRILEEKRRRGLG